MSDMDFDTYQVNLNRLAAEVLISQVSAHEFLEDRLKSEDVCAIETVIFREKMLVGSDREKVADLLAMGFFRGFSVDRRAAAFLVSFDISTAARRKDLQVRFERYSEGQPLFQKSPKLLSYARNTELIDSSGVSGIDDDGIVTLENGFGLLDPMLPPSLVRTMSDSYPHCRLYVRLDPQKFWTTRPTQLLTEATLVPANPRWWEALALHRGEGTGGSYFIDPAVSPKDDLEAYWEYHGKGLRRLETIAQRKKEKHLTFMLEELQLLDDELLIGRCIHLDTFAEYGVSPDLAKVLHVDLAINVYVDDRIQERINGQLNNSDKVDANFRTHLLRTEGVPFEVSALLSALFFKSSILKRDLFGNQFQRAAI